MIARGKKNLLGVLVDAVDYEAAVEKIIAGAKRQQPMAVSALAVHGVMTGVSDAAHRYRLNHLDLVAPDGQPVRWALNLLHGAALSDRVYGPTLALKVCEAAAREKLAIFLYGSRENVLKKLAKNLTTRFPGLTIAGAEASKFRTTTDREKEEIAARIKASGASIVFAGLGCPRQEVWAYEYRERLSMPILAIGAAFDFHAGLLPQAPPRLQRLGLEWLFRLLQEPRRLWRRYLLLNPAYVALFLLQLSRLKKFNSTRVSPPAHALNYG
jgi:exopolysaccharide biosynthesis WecB/TagA/CpsF family protein